jgi:hypothetical protein
MHATEHVTKKPEKANHVFLLGIISNVIHQKNPPHSDRYRKKRQTNSTMEKNDLKSGEIFKNQWTKNFLSFDDSKNGLGLERELY